MKKLGGLAKSGLSVASAGIAAVSAGLLGVGGYAVSVGSDFESGMSEVAAISGASGEALQALTDKAKEMGSTTKFSATESAEALKYMAMAGWDTDKMLSGLPGVMNLAAASGENLGTVSDIVTDSMTAFGMAAGEAGRFADILAQASSKSNTNVSLMGETFKYVAPVAGALGYSAEDAAVAIGLMANSGIKGSQAGTALRS
ncbi:MAG: phage tail tape measure protein, partial [Ruminococcus bromii]|nr:phage tail tape measure protein [Ruminococcus bromii]